MIKALNFLKNSYRLSYSKAMYEAWKSNPADVHEDWDLVFKSASASGSEETSPNLQREKELALTAYLFIRYYKQRGHELAELDPLRLVNFKEFGKKYVKNSVEHELNKLKEVRKNDLDEPFTFPNHPVFQKKIAVSLCLCRVSQQKKPPGLSEKSSTSQRISIRATLASNSCTSPTPKSDFGS